MVTVPADHDGSSTVELVADLDGVVARLEHGDIAAAGVDIPIGLPETGARRCDVEARAMLGPRRNSVFPAPVRGLLGAVAYEDAVAGCRALTGKGLSRQAFGILSKVGEVDRVMTPERQRLLVEVHPEVSFALLSGGPTAHYKKTPAGGLERLEALRDTFPDVGHHVEARIRGAGTDDVLDAFAVAWSARRWLWRSHVRLGGERDKHDLRMEIIV